MPPASWIHWAMPVSEPRLLLPPEYTEVSLLSHCFSVGDSESWPKRSASDRGSTDFSRSERYNGS
ncbi:MULTISPECIES: hypothetical protein [Streptomyces]|uniref:Uncharacterized protein n=1 Tax=Streptomyces doudnae TaxID=3075536 RepID=A0ABD5F105_9ACTN|nr:MULTISPECIES: hypothetical protein [unclassified Streptomyces]MDT0440284.1 hypothetical protein [Streptomyces sp. DSM 41981]MYQ62057.1 hypothetical protein [Streptomyces sp. SID4950]